MKTNYETIKGIFTQKNLVDAMIGNIKSLNLDPISKGEFSYLCWRYVFMKDITKKNFTGKLLKLGLDNLTVVEVTDSLNATKNLVKDIISDCSKEK